MSDSSNEFVETPVAPPEWDTGVFEVYDGAAFVALLWVTNGGDKLQSTEYWGLAPGWVWPSSTNTVKTFKFTYTTAYTITNTTQFKSACDTKFGAGLTVYQKHTTTTF